MRVESSAIESFGGESTFRDSAKKSGAMIEGPGPGSASFRVFFMGVASSKMGSSRVPPIAGEDGRVPSSDPDGTVRQLP
jgi:hypothetical protein